MLSSQCLDFRHTWYVAGNSNQSYSLTHSPKNIILMLFSVTFNQIGSIDFVLLFAFMWLLLFLKVEYGTIREVVVTKGGFGWLLGHAGGLQRVNLWSSVWTRFCTILTVRGELHWLQTANTSDMCLQLKIWRPVILSSPPGLFQKHQVDFLLCFAVLQFHELHIDFLTVHKL